VRSAGRSVASLVAASRMDVVERGFWSSVEERGTAFGPEVHH
jgi:hypothetical protein